MKTMLNNSTDELRLQQLEMMMLIRAYEEQVVELNRHGAPGTCTSVGQEACAVGVVSALQQHDKILTNHRSAAHLLARGADPKRLLAEVLGRIDGYCGGRSGPLHISARELGVVLTSTIVGGELSMAPGVALAQKMGEGDAGAITTVFFGDGAACEGILHESLNLAFQWKLPILFVCENNQWQAYVHRLETMGDEAIASWARGHGLPVNRVDGNDVTAVYNAATEVVNFIRKTSTPCFLELMTYRQRGHFEPDDQSYVDKDELLHWSARDPIKQLVEQLLTAGVVSAKQMESLQAQVKSRISAAATFAQASAWPSPETLRENVYA